MAPGSGRAVDELVDRDHPFALGTQVDEDAPPSGADDLAHLEAGPGFLPSDPLRRQAAGAIFGLEPAGLADVEGGGVEALHRGFELGVEVVVPLFLERGPDGGLGGPAGGGGVERGIDRGVRVGGSAGFFVEHRSCPSVGQPTSSSVAQRLGSSPTGNSRPTPKDRSPRSGSVTW